MALDFVGMDPDSPDLKCPAVYVDPGTGDFYFQGKIVKDPLILAEIAKHSPDRGRRVGGQAAGPDGLDHR